MINTKFRTVDTYGRRKRGDIGVEHAKVFHGPKNVLQCYEVYCIGFINIISRR